MSADISKNDLSNFFIHKLHTTKISFSEAKKMGIDVNEYKYADTNDDNSFDIDEIADVKELYAAFTAIVQSEQEDDVKDEDKEKDEQNKVADKSGAGAA